MKLDHDLVRYTLLSIEASENFSGPSEDELLERINKYHPYDRKQVVYTIDKLKEADYISGKVTYANDQPMWINAGNLTYEGHKFLDNIRDDGIWKDTKKVVSKLSSVSLPIIANVASTLIAQVIQQKL